jgi:hypothetical protein
VPTVVVLISKGQLLTVHCDREDVFLVAKLRNAGICGVCPSKASADTLIAKLQGEQARIGRYIGDAEPLSAIPRQCRC